MQVFHLRKDERSGVSSEDANGSYVVYLGQIYAKKPSFGFVRADQDGLEAFITAANLNMWDQVSVGQRISYIVGFNLDGPVAINGKAA